MTVHFIDLTHASILYAFLSSLIHRSHSFPSIDPFFSISFSIGAAPSSRNWRERAIGPKHSILPLLLHCPILDSPELFNRHPILHFPLSRFQLRRRHSLFAFMRSSYANCLAEFVRMFLRAEQWMEDGRSVYRVRLKGGLQVA